ncbi:N-acetylmuramoyl-L-alanine amidase [Paenibacillus lactis]|uniref:peptidoglycan recognition protein family protein n=1 Tax=Paenibacillus lactis TaxID=228574 RepID=UPI003D73221C
MQQQGQFILLNCHEFYEWLQQQTLTRTITLLQNHHTWAPNYTSFNGKNHFARLVAMKNYHVKTNGWSDIGQNITTFPDGMIAICRSFNVTPAGIKGANTGALCMEHIGNFDANGDSMSEEQKKTIAFINAALCEKLKLPITTEHIVYHHWYSSSGAKVYNFVNGKRLSGTPAKSCPGTAFFKGNTVSDAKKNFIPLVKEAYNNLNKKDDEPMTSAEKQEFEKLQQTVINLKNELNALVKSKNVLKKGAQEQGASIKKVKERVESLEKKHAMDIPSYAKEAVDALTKLKDPNGNPVVNTPEGRSADFYSLVTVLYRAGLFK